MKYFLQTTVFVLLTSIAFGQIWRDEISQGAFDLGWINSSTDNPYNGGTGPKNDNSGWPNNNLTRLIVANLTVSGISRGSGTTGAAAISAFGATDFSSSGSLDPNDYFEFKLTPASGYKINFTGFTYVGGGGIDLTPPNNFAFRSSLDGFAANIGTPTLAGTTINLSAAQFQNITSAITFRLYAWRSGGSPNYWEIQSFRFDGAIALPVVFGKVEAAQKGNALNVKWTTNSETNNDHFEVQASKDGKEFKTIKTVQSLNGNSDTEQKYEVAISASDVASVLAFPAVLGLLSIGVNRRKRLVLLAAGLVLATASFVACNKQDAVNVSSGDHVFIRIKQVDKDGDFKYSEVVRAITD